MPSARRPSPAPATARYCLPPVATARQRLAELPDTRTSDSSGPLADVAATRCGASCARQHGAWPSSHSAGRRLPLRLPLPPLTSLPLTSLLLTLLLTRAAPAVARLTVLALVFVLLVFVLLAFVLLAFVLVVVLVAVVEVLLPLLLLTREELVWGR